VEEYSRSDFDTSLQVSDSEREEDKLCIQTVFEKDCRHRFI